MELVLHLWEHYCCYSGRLLSDLPSDQAESRSAVQMSSCLTQVLSSEHSESQIQNQGLMTKKNTMNRTTLNTSSFVHHVYKHDLKNIVSVYMWSLYQSSMCIGGISRGDMGVTVGCGMCIALHCRSTIMMGIGKHQTLAQTLC